MEIARTFFKEGVPDVSKENQKRLKSLFVTMLDLCAEALKVNKGLIGADQEVWYMCTSMTTLFIIFQEIPIGS
jgi:hypothetical protein